MAERKRKRQTVPHIFKEREYLEWRDRVLSWPAAVDRPVRPRIEELPEEYQREFLKRMLKARRHFAGPDDFSHRILEGDE